MKLERLAELAKEKGFLAADKSAADLIAIIQAADGLPGNVASSKEIMDKRAKDRAARDEKKAADRAARDEKRAADRKARDEKCAADRKARDEAFEKTAKDADTDPEHTNDAEMKAEAEDEAKYEAEDEGDTPAADPSTPGGNRGGGKPAVDSATVDQRIAAALASQSELYEARNETASIIGVTAYDSAAKTYRAALKQLAVDTAGVPDAALKPMLTLAKQRTESRTPTPVTADSALVAGMASLIPGYNRLG